jgi:hypothetical protein
VLHGLVRLSIAGDDPPRSRLAERAAALVRGLLRAAGLSNTASRFVIR